MMRSVLVTAPVPAPYVERYYVGDGLQVIIPLLPPPLDRSSQVRVHVAPDDEGGRRVEIIGDARMEHIDRLALLEEARERLHAALVTPDGRATLRVYAADALALIEERAEGERRVLRGVWGAPGVIESEAV